MIHPSVYKEASSRSTRSISCVCADTFKRLNVCVCVCLTGLPVSLFPEQEMRRVRVSVSGAQTHTSSLSDRQIELSIFHRPSIFHIHPAVFLSSRSVTVTDPFIFRPSNLYFISAVHSPPLQSPSINITIIHLFSISHSSHLQGGGGGVGRGFLRVDFQRFCVLV